MVIPPNPSSTTTTRRAIAWPRFPIIEQDIYVGQDFYVPAYRVRVRRQALLQAEYDVLSVTYTDSDSGHGLLRPDRQQLGS